MDYNTTEQSKLSTFFNQPKASQLHLKVGKHQYVVDKDKMQQRNKEYKTVRAIRWGKPDEKPVLTYAPQESTQQNPRPYSVEPSWKIPKKHQAAPALPPPGPTLWCTGRCEVRVPDPNNPGGLWIECGQLCRLEHLHTEWHNCQEHHKDGNPWDTMSENGNHYT